MVVVAPLLSVFDRVITQGLGEAGVKSAVGLEKSSKLNKDLQPCVGNKRVN